MTPSEIYAQRDEYILQALCRKRSLVFTRASGARFWDTHGKTYLDTMSGSAGPGMIGHAHPRVADAVARQMRELPTVNIAHSAVPVIELAARMAKIAPAGLNKTFLCTGGGEAIEAAIKFALRITGRNEVLSLTGGYHGMSLATMGLCGMQGARKWFPGAMRWPTFRQVPSGDVYRPPLGVDGPDGWKPAIKALEAELEGGSYNQVAALVIELVQGPNGHSVYAPEYYQAIQRLCRERGILLIVDEIQTGLGRCGKMWACDVYDVKPDILAIGKAFGGGMPIGAIMTRKDLVPESLAAEPWHIMTFMNQPIVAAAALATLDVIEDEKLVERAQRLGAEATAFFQKLAQRFSVIGDVRGPGLFIGVDYVTDRATRTPATAICAEAWEYALDEGLIVQFGGIYSNVLKFKPPLSTPEAEFQQMLALVEKITTFIQRKVDGKGKPV